MHNIAILDFHNSLKCNVIMSNNVLIITIRHDYLPSQYHHDYIKCRI